MRHHPGGRTAQSDPPCHLDREIVAIEKHQMPGMLRLPQVTVARRNRILRRRLIWGADSAAGSRTGRVIRAYSSGAVSGQLTPCFTGAQTCPATAGIDHAGQDHRNDRRHAANQRRGVARHRGRPDPGLSHPICPRPRRRRLRPRARRLHRIVRRRLPRRAARRGAYQAARLSGGASAGIRRADLDGAQDRDVRPSDQRPARRAHHHRQDRRRAAGRWRLQPEGRALQARRGISRIDEAHLGERKAVRFRRRILPRQGRLLRCAPAAAAASAVVLRRRLRWRARDGRQTLRRLCHLRRAAEVDARAHRELPRPGRGFRTNAGLQCLAPPDHRRRAKATPGTRPTGFSRR